MKNSKQNLIIAQIDEKLSKLNKLEPSFMPNRGWIYTIRTALKMPLALFGKRLGISKQAAQKIESRENEGAITIKTLKHAANSLGMELVYYLVPQKESIREMVDDQAIQKAKEIVLRTSHSMLLEDQKNSEARIQTAIKEKAEEIKREMPKYLWD
ncbi:MAG: mobile mystery protein A [Ignavibacteriaceae bacterium]|jgi:predicted DNA-binding mobile mystery protein A